LLRILRLMPALAGILAVAGLIAIQFARPEAGVATTLGHSGTPFAPKALQVEAPPAPSPVAPSAAPPAAVLPSLPSAGSPLRQEDPHTIRVATWNLRDCAATDRSTGERIAFHDEIAAVLRDMKADIALFQEIQQDDEKGGDIALLQVALASAGWAMPWQVSGETGGQDDLAIFSRYPIRESRLVIEPATRSAWPRPGLYALVEAGKTRLEFFNFHFKAMDESRSAAARKAQARALADFLRAGNELPAGTSDAPAMRGTPQRAIILGGDFNTVSPGDREGSDATLVVLQLRDDADPSNDLEALNETWLKGVPTYVDDRYRSVTDHLIVSGNLVPEPAARNVSIISEIPSKGRIPLSDHRPVVAELRLL
jgi:endonuclease/exonuclease/phosphatase family metal-dependent hydrolase